MIRNIINKYNKGLYDFHTHSTHSDGEDTPTALVEIAKKYGISALALTDHNTDSGLEEFISSCNQNEIFAIPFGIEIFVELPREIVSLGENESPDMLLLGKNPKKEHFAEYQKILTKDRQNRWFIKILNKLEESGFFVPYLNKKEVKITIDPPNLSHVLEHKDNADILIEHIKTWYPDENHNLKKEDILKNPEYYANKFLYAPNRRCYVKTIEGFSVKDALGLAEAMNCRLFIAHPGGGHNLNEKILNYYIQQGVHGIEIRNYSNTPEQNIKFDRLAEKHNLIRSGGSDYHGKGIKKIGIYDKSQNQLSKEILEELWFNLPE